MPAEVQLRSRGDIENGSLPQERFELTSDGAEFRCLHDRLALQDLKLLRHDISTARQISRARIGGEAVHHRTGTFGVTYHFVGSMFREWDSGPAERSRVSIAD